MLNVERTFGILKAKWASVKVTFVLPNQELMSDNHVMSLRGLLAFLRPGGLALRSHSFFPIRSQCRIITACCHLDNLITREMPDDPFEQELIRNQIMRRMSPH